MFRPDAQPVVAPGRPAAFLDRDGTLNEACPDPDSGAPESPLTVEDVHLLPGAAAALSRLADAGYALVCATNQPAAAKGKVPMDRLLSVHERVIGLLSQQGVQVEASLLCPHHPDGVVRELSWPCPCRKPAPGMLLDAAATLGLELDGSWMLGDTDTDVTAGQAAGCRTILIEYPGSAHKRQKRSTHELSAANLGDAVAQLLDQSSR